MQAPRSCAAPVHLTFNSNVRMQFGPTGDDRKKEHRKTFESIEFLVGGGIFTNIYGHMDRLLTDIQAVYHTGKLITLKH